MTNIFIFGFRSARTIKDDDDHDDDGDTDSPLLYITRNGCFKNFKYEKQRETIEFFFRALTSSIVDSIAIALLK
jgi:hypothetical protein